MPVQISVWLARPAGASSSGIQTSLPRTVTVAWLDGSPLAVTSWTWTGPPTVAPGTCSSTAVSPQLVMVAVAPPTVAVPAVAPNEAPRARTGSPGATTGGSSVRIHGTTR